jgi:LysM repeat protein
MVAMRWPVVAATVFVAVAGLVVGGSPATAYTVRQGDTLWKISRQTGFSVSDLARVNGISDPSRIYPGQQLQTAAPPAPPAAAPAGATYRVRSGDTLWSISRRTGVSVADLARLNSLQAPFVIHPGQQLKVSQAPSAAATVAPASPKRSVSVSAARALLTKAANDHGLRPSFVLALSYWESGWNQDVVSSTGAVGLMQIEPYTAAYAGPRYLGRKVDISDARDNTELGAALLRAYVDEFNDPKLALAAYYQGPSAVRRYGIYPSSQSYVDGIWDIRNRIEAGRL